MAKFVETGRAYRALYDAGIVTEAPENVRRCVIDLEVGSVAKIYIEKFADEKLIDVLLTADLVEVA